MTDQPKRTRNTRQLGAGEASDIILELEQGLAPAISAATDEVEARYYAKQQAILARVPIDLRARCVGMVTSQNPDLGERLESSPALIGEPLEEPEPRLSANLMRQPEPMPAPIEGKARGAR